MSTENKGEISIEECDDANVPVNIFISEPDEDCTEWRLTADNFMPRKGHVAQGQYVVESDSQAELRELVTKYVVPLYKAALTNLQERGANYYWEISKS